MFARFERTDLPAVVGLTAMAYTWTTVRQIKTLTRICDEQRIELQRLTVTYQETVIPALAEVHAMLKRLREDRL